jgi:hypothetical protein
LAADEFIEEIVMNEFHFHVCINAPVEKVWVKMIEPESYKAWTMDFAEGSYYEGCWEKGEKIKFLGPGGDGIISMVAEHRPLEFTSLKHIGFYKDGIEDTESPEVKAWAPLHENYTFISKKGVTEVKIDVEIPLEWGDDMEKAWPKALEKLKATCE